MKASLRPIRFCWRRKPRLNFEIDQQTRRVRLLRLSSQRLGASLEDRKDKLVTEEKLAEAEGRLQGLLARQQSLILRAQATGKAQFSMPLRPGAWVSPGDQLMFIHRPQSRHVVAYLDEDHMHRVSVGAAAKFIAADGMSGSFAAAIVEIDGTAVEALPHLQLASAHGGDIAGVSETADAGFVPDRAYYKLRAAAGRRHGACKCQHCRPAAYRYRPLFACLQMDPRLLGLDPA